MDNRTVQAAVMMLMAMSVLGLIDNFIAVIAKHIGIWQFHAMRSLLMGPLLVIMSMSGLGTLRPKRPGAVLARSVVLTTSMLLYFGSLGMMPIAQALAGLFTAPIFVVLINVVVMGQRIGIWRVAAVLVGFAGTLLVLQPGGEQFGPVMAMPVAAGFFYAIAAIATRSWCEGESALTLLGANMGLLGLCGILVSIGMGVLGLAGGETFLNRGWTWEMGALGAVVPWIVVQACLSLAAVFLIIRAYQLDEPSNVGVFEYSVMIFGPVFGWAFFGQALGLGQGLGIILILFAGATIALRSRRAKTT